MVFQRVSKMYNWGYGVSESHNHKYLNLILFLSSAFLAILLFLIFFPQINAINNESPILINLMFIPAMAVGFLYGMRITERAVKPSETRSPFKRSIVKIFLYFFVIGGLFSSVNFAINGGSIMPQLDIAEVGLIPWINEFVTANGGATFLIITSITLMAAATKKIVGMNAGILNRLVTFVGTFVFSVYVNHMVNARTMLPMAPAAAILMTRRMENRLCLFRHTKMFVLSSGTLPCYI